MSRRLSCVISSLVFGPLVSRKHTWFYLRKLHVFSAVESSFELCHFSSLVSILWSRENTHDFIYVNYMPFQQLAVVVASLVWSFGLGKRARFHLLNYTSFNSWVVVSSLVLVLWSRENTHDFIYVNYIPFQQLSRRCIVSVDPLVSRKHTWFYLRKLHVFSAVESSFHR